MTLTHVGRRNTRRGKCEVCGTETNWMTKRAASHEYAFWCGCGNGEPVVGIKSVGPAIVAEIWLVGHGYQINVECDEAGISECRDFGGTYRLSRLKRAVWNGLFNLMRTLESAALAPKPKTKRAKR